LRITQSPNDCGALNGLVGMEIPRDCAMRVTGVITQVDPTQPYLTNHQLQPRGPDDLELNCPVPTEVRTWSRLKAQYR
jgi:hypothetical protein